MLTLIIRYTNAFTVHHIKNHNDGWHTEHWTPIDKEELNTFLTACCMLAFCNGIMKTVSNCGQQILADIFFQLH